MATTLPAALPDDAPHLLVVDDDRRIRDLLSRFLTGEGYRVTTAETAS
ncbi:MAG: DNA-binding response regulator, partial [Pseudolabrys sp.]